MGTGWARYDGIQSQIHGLFDEHRPAVLIELTRGPVLVSKGCGRDQLTVCRVQHIEKTVLGGLHDDASISAILSQWQIREHDLLCRGVIPSIPRRGLVVPTVFARVSVHRQNR